jgi:hypothetical protein
MRKTGGEGVVTVPQPAVVHDLVQRLAEGVPQLIAEVVSHLAVVALDGRGHWGWRWCSGAAGQVGVHDGRLFSAGGCTGLVEKSRGAVLPAG